MPVPANIAALSQTPASNSPPGSESPTTADDYMRTIFAFIAQLAAGANFTGVLPVANGGTGGATGAAARTALGLDAYSGRRKNINGDFSINQRALTSPRTLAASARGHDGWKAGASGCTYSWVTTNNMTTITITAGSLVQVVDGAKLQSGTHILSWTGTAQGKLNGGAYGATGQTSALTGGTNASIEFNTGTLTLVQCEPGTDATKYDHRDDELNRCRRYYQVATNPEFSILPIGSGSQLNCSSVRFGVPMRAAPTVSPTVTGGSATLASFFSVSPDGFTLILGGGQYDYVQYTWNATAEL